MIIINHNKTYWSLITTITIVLMTLTVLRPLTLDELNTVYLISRNDLYFILEWVRDHDTQMPLFYILAKSLYPVSSFNAFTLRLPSLVYVFLSLLIAYKYISHEKNHLMAKRFVLMALCSYFLFHQGFLYRPYGLLFLTSSIAFMAYNKKTPLTFYLSLIFLALTHYFGLALALLLFFCRVFSLNRNKSKREVILALLFIVLISLFLRPLYSDIIKDFFVIHTYRSLSLPYLYDQFIFFHSGIFATIVAYLIFVFEVPKKTGQFHNLLICFIILMMCLLKALISTPIIEARYFIIALFPFFYLISKHSLSKSYYILVFSMLIPFVTTYPYNKLNTQQLGNYLNGKFQKNNDTVITSCDMNLKFYVPIFNDCYSNFSPRNKNVLYIKNTRSPSDCSCLRLIKSLYKLKETNNITEAEVLHFEKI